MKRTLTISLLLLLILLGLAGTNQASAQEWYYGCNQPGRLYVNGGGRVTTFPNLPNRLRSHPSFSGVVIGHIPAGGYFYVVGGPECTSGLRWWQVSYNGMIGWTAEGDGYLNYYLEPAGFVPPTPTPVNPPVCALPNRLSVGNYGRVTPGLPNVVRTAPGTTSSGANSVVIGEIPGGGIFHVQGGPVCGPDRRWWWYVNYNNLVGWTAEGEGANIYWVEPWHGGNVAVCPNALPSRLIAGSYGRVMPYPELPNRIRSAPNYGGAVLGHIPAGATFYIISGPNCADNTAWWQVSYNGITGWTAEGSGPVYWLEPA